jgi:hypothetical protein
MGNEFDQSSRRGIILNQVIDKLGKIKGTSKAFLRGQYLLDIAELGPIIIPDSKIEIWENFVEGVFELNGGSFDKFVQLVGPGFRLLVQYFDMRSDVIIDDTPYLDYDFTYNKRNIKISKEKIKNFRQNKNKLIITENDLFSLLKENEKDIKIFFDSIEKADDKRIEISPPPNKKINIDPEIIESLYKRLNPYFTDHKKSLKDILEGKKSNVKLTLPFKQNQFVDLFLRLKEKGFITNNKLEIKDWICENFNRVGGKPFNGNSVYDILKKKSTVSKNSRIFEDLSSKN